MAANDIIIKRGDSKTIKDVVTKTEDGVTSVMILTDYVAKLTIKKAKEFDTYLLQKTIDPIPDAANGIIVFELSFTETELPAGKWIYDIQIYNSDTGKKHTVTEGKCEITNDVTK